MRKEPEAKDVARKCTPIPKPSEFAISLAAYVQTETGMCPLCGHEEEAQVNNKQESYSN
jgi:RNA polymerase subunit RPABC4/transcription elongation factor Spt4